MQDFKNYRAPGSKISSEAIFWAFMAAAGFFVVWNWADTDLIQYRNELLLAAQYCQ